MEPHIHTLTIERFRAIRQLKVEGLGRVNLITGKNNTGKSSVLEALRLLASGAAPAVIYDILRSREEDDGDAYASPKTNGDDGLLQVCGLFNGFPNFSAENEPIVIASRGEMRRLDLFLRTVFFRRSPGGEVTLAQPQQSLFGEGVYLPALEVRVSSEEPRYVIRDFLTSSPSRWTLFAEGRLPCVFVGAYGGEETAKLGSLWDKIALSDGEKAIVEALRIIDPNIVAVSMVGGEGPRKQRRAIVRAEGLPRPVPLRTFGDGLNRVFDIALSLVNAKGGLLLIDEFENGMHHTVQTDVWRAIFKLSKDLDIQVFATSHSWDSVEAFQKAASEVPEEGVLVRLTRKGQDIIPTTFSEGELAIATRDRIEVR